MNSNKKKSGSIALVVFALLIQLYSSGSILYATTIYGKSEIPGWMDGVFGGAHGIIFSLTVMLFLPFSLVLLSAAYRNYSSNSNQQRALMQVTWIGGVLLSVGVTLGLIIMAIFIKTQNKTFDVIITCITPLLTLSVVGLLLCGSIGYLITLLQGDSADVQKSIKKPALAVICIGGIMIVISIIAYFVLTPSPVINAFIMSLPNALCIVSALILLIDKKKKA